MGRTAAIGDQKAQTSKAIEPEWFEEDPRWLLAQRIAASQPFARSRLLSKFLLYIVAETLADRKSEISEHLIGVQVFDRPPNYRSVEDNIVRTYARQLRRRLSEYFAHEGAAEPLQIDIPLGGYVPVFVAVPAEQDRGAIVELTDRPDSDGTAIEASPPSAPHSSIDVFQPISAVKTARRPWHRPLLLGLLLVAYSFLLVWIAVFAADRLRARDAAATDTDPTAPLWAALFGGAADCYIVPADAGFNLLEDLSHRSLPLAAYVNGSFLNIPLKQMDEHSADDLRGQHFTSFVDLQTVTALARLAEFNPHRVILRFPRDLQLDDLRASNAIILGSMSSNPWAMIAESNANFRIVNGATMHDATILNIRPQSGEAPSYASHWNQSAHETYATIAFLPNLRGNGHLLLVQGLDVAGTQAAAEMLLHPTSIASVLQRAMRPDGSLRSFEVLLRSSSIESRSTTAEIIGSRIY